MRHIQLQNGGQFIIDDDDFNLVSQYKWSSYKDGVQRHKGKRGSMKTIYLHRVLLNAPEHLVVDHKNGNKLDNRRSNIRLATRQQNNQNCPKKCHNLSGYKGVGFAKHTNKWRAYISVNNTYKHLGYFDSKKDAAKAYNKAAIEYHKDFANINLI